MALKIKLTRIGARHKPFYRIVIAEARSRRDGASVEQLGTYQPTTATPVKVDLARVDHWMKNGAVPTNTVRALIKHARRSAPAAAPASTPATS